MEQKITIPDGFELKQINEFEYRVVKKEELPNSWQQFCETHPIKHKKEYYIANRSEIYVFENDWDRNPDKDRNVLPSKEKAEAIIALCQLIQLRDCYNDGWKPNWKENNWKPCIDIKEDRFELTEHCINECLFVFKTAQLRDKFLENFKDLLEKVKPLFY